MAADSAFSPTGLSADEWDRELRGRAAAHFMQSALWGEFKSRYGWRVDRLALPGDKGDTLASVLSRQMVYGRLRLGYVPRGPSLAALDGRHLDAALAGLEGLARQPGYLALKVEPELWDGDLPWAREVLLRRGWRPAEPVQFRNTVTLAIDRPDGDLLAAMKPKTRYNVRLAEKRGVEARPAADADLGAMYDLYRETATRDGFIVRPRSYYEDLWARLRHAGMGEVCLAWLHGRALAGVVVVAYGDTGWYLHGASTDEGRNLMPTYLLQWWAVRWCRERGCSTYDMWGAPETSDEHDPMHGVLRFKLGFGGAPREGLGAWDYAPRRLPYLAYTTLLPRLLSMTRAARRRSQRRE